MDGPRQKRNLIIFFISSQYIIIISGGKKKGFLSLLLFKSKHYYRSTYRPVVSSQAKQPWDAIRDEIPLTCCMAWAIGIRVLLRNKHWALSNKILAKCCLSSIQNILHYSRAMNLVSGVLEIKHIYELR